MSERRAKRSKDGFVFVKNKAIVVSNNERTLKQKKGSACAVVAKGISEGCSTWKVLIEKECGAGLNVGVVANKGEIDIEQHNKKRKKKQHSL